MKVRTGWMMVAAGAMFSVMAAAAMAQPSVGEVKAQVKQEVKAGVQQAFATPIIPRKVLFGNAERAQGKISPDGKQIAFIAPVNGVLNVWVGPIDKIADAKPVTNDDKRGIRQFGWAYTNQNIIFAQDKGGDENWRLYGVDLTSGAIKDFTPFEKTQARIVATSDRFPDEIVVGLNNRAEALHDLHKLNVRTGELKELMRNDGYAEFTVDDDYRVRLASKINKDGGADMFKAVEGGKSGFEPWMTIPMADANTTSVVDFNKDGTKAYLIDSRDRNTAALFELDIASGKKTLLFEDAKSDVANVLINPITKVVEAVQTDYKKPIWNVLNPGSVEIDLMAIYKAAGDGTVNVLSRTQDDRKWTVAVVSDKESPKTWLVDRGDPTDTSRKPKVTQLWDNRPALAGQPLVPMNPVIIKSRDGLELVSYLSLPSESDPDQDGKPSAALPMVLFVHGGPWARDSWGLDPTHQWLANRGYAVLSVNFRASTGFGKEFLNKGNLEWAGKMHDDLIDAVDWAVKQKIADPKKVAIMGGSYGGYATLVGLTFTPDVFACGVDVVGPSSLATLLNSIPAYWGPALDLMTKQVGDHRTPEGKKFLDSRSPLTFVDKIKKPLLIGQGANDPRVKQAEADQIVHAMQAKNIPVTYVLFPDEGHGFARPVNRLSFNAVAEAFLAGVLGGRVEPIGETFKGASIQVPVGGEHVQGVSEALASMGKSDAAPAKPSH